MARSQREITSRRMAEVLDVLDRVYRARPATPKDATADRIQAEKDVARSRDISRQSVHGACARQIHLRAPEFDRLIWQWLREGSDGLYSQLISEMHGVDDDYDDYDDIQDFFNEVPGGGTA